MLACKSCRFQPDLSASAPQVNFVYTPPARKNRVPHLRADCIHWLLAYAADELACQGVSCGDATSDGTPQKANCAIENVHLEWNFASRVWDATFVGGHAQGEFLQFGPTDVTPALLKKLRGLDVANNWYSKSNSSSNRMAAKEYVLMWCKAVHEMRVAEHNAIFQNMLGQVSTKCDVANAPEAEAPEADAEDGDAPEADGVADNDDADSDDDDADDGEDEAPDAAAADVSAAGA